MFSTLSHIFISLHCNHCWSFKHALNIIPSKNLTYFNKTPIIQHKASILKEFMPCLLTLFWQNSTTLSPLSTRASSRKPRLQPCPKPPRRRRRRRCRCRRRQVPLRHRRAPSADPAPPLAPAAKVASEASAVSPQKPAPPIKGSAGPRVDWNMLELALLSLDALVSNTALSAGQNCSSESSRRAA